MGYLEVHYTKKGRERSCFIEEMVVYDRGVERRYSSVNNWWFHKTEVVLRPTVEVGWNRATPELLEKVKRGEIAVLDKNSEVLYVSFDFLRKRVKGIPFSSSSEERTYYYFGTRFDFKRYEIIIGKGEMDRAEFISYELLREERVGYEIVKKTVEGDLTKWVSLELKTKDNTWSAGFRIKGNGKNFVVKGFCIVDNYFIPASEETKEREKEYWREKLRRDLDPFIEELKKECWERLQQLQKKAKELIGYAPETTNDIYFWSEVAEGIEKKYGVPVSSYYAALLLDGEFSPYAKEILEKVREKGRDYYKNLCKVLEADEDGHYAVANNINGNDPVEWGAFVIGAYGKSDLVVSKCEVKDGKTYHTAYV